MKLLQVLVCAKTAPTVDSRLSKGKLNALWINQRAAGIDNFFYVTTLKLSYDPTNRKNYDF
jgi:hypothetical protein